MSNEEGTDRKLLVDVQQEFGITGDDVKAQTSTGKPPVSFLNLFAGQRG